VAQVTPQGFTSDPYQAIMGQPKQDVWQRVMQEAMVNALPMMLGGAGMARMAPEFLKKGDFAKYALRYDGPWDLSSIGKGLQHQFTMYGGPAKGATFVTKSLDEPEVLSNLQRVVGNFAPKVVQKSDKVKTLITKPVRDFHTKMKSDVAKGVEVMKQKISEYSGWRYDVGDKLKSSQTGKIYRITSRGWDRRQDRPMYWYKSGDESGTMIADKVHSGKTLTKVERPKIAKTVKPKWYDK